MSRVPRPLLLIIPGLLWATVACDGSASGTVPLQPRRDTLRVTVHWDQTAQTLQGFGASDAWSIQHVGLWPDPIRQDIAERLFSRDTDGEGRPRGEVVGSPGGSPVAWQPFVTSEAFDLAPAGPEEAGSRFVVPRRSVVTLVGVSPPGRQT